MKKIIAGIRNFKYLPKKTKVLISLGMSLALFAALPLFLWAILTQQFDIRKRAQSGDQLIVYKLEGETCTLLTESQTNKCATGLYCESQNTSQQSSLSGICLTRNDNYAHTCEICDTSGKSCATGLSCKQTGGKTCYAPTDTLPGRCKTLPNVSVCVPDNLDEKECFLTAEEITQPTTPSPSSSSAPSTAFPNPTSNSYESCQICQTSYGPINTCLIKQYPSDTPSHGRCNSDNREWQCGGLTYCCNGYWEICAPTCNDDCASNAANCSSSLQCTTIGSAGYTDQSGQEVQIKRCRNSGCSGDDDCICSTPPAFWCNKRCYQDSDCNSPDMFCSPSSNISENSTEPLGVCKNKNCPNDSDCYCNQASPTATSLPVPSPSASISSVNPTIKIKIKFRGVNDGSAEGAKITLRFTRKYASSNNLITSPISVIHEANGVYSATVSLSNIPLATDYYIIVKGEKHLATRFYKSSGQTARYSASVNETISIFNTTAEQIFDFTGIPLEPGDVYHNGSQDGVCNMEDMTAIISILGKSYDLLTASDLKTADLNYDGVVNVQDILLIRKTLETRYDEN